MEKFKVGDTIYCKEYSRHWASYFSANIPKHLSYPITAKLLKYKFVNNRYHAGMINVNGKDYGISMEGCVKMLKSESYQIY